MVDDVNIKNIEELNRAVGWAKEATLSRLVSAANDQVSLLETLAKVKAVELRNIKKADAGFAEVGDAAGQAADALKKGAADRKKTDRELNESIRDLRWSMSRHGSQISNLLTRSTNPMTQLPSAIESTTDWLAKFAKGNKIATVAVMAIGTAIAKLAERFIEAAESYRGMMQSGVMFNGSVSTMIQNVRSAGVGIEAASQVIDQYSQALLSVGETKFFKNIEDSTKTFARLGMTQEQGMRTFAELEEMRRLSGLSYMQSEDDRIKSNEQLVQLMQSQSILTGISNKRQKEAAQKAAETERVRIMQASLSAEQLKQQQEATFKLAGLGLRPEAIEAALIEAMGGGVTAAGAAAGQALGPEYNKMVAAIQSGRIEEIGTQEQREALKQYTTQLLQATPMLGRGGATAQLIGGMALDVRAATLPATTARPGQETELEKRKRLAERAARGEQIVDNTTQAYFQTVNNTAVALGRVEALAFRLADPVISGLIQSLSLLSGAVNNVVGGAAGFSDTTLYGGLAAGAAGMYMMKRMFSGGAGLPGMPGMPQMFGPPAPPNLPGAGGAGGQPYWSRSLAPRVGMGTMAGGLAGGALGIGGGAYQAAYGQDRASRMMGIGISALSGAAAGAMFGPAGIAIGGLLGAGAGALANYYGAGGTPAAEPGGAMGGDFGAGLSSLAASIAAGLGPSGAIVSELREIKLQLQATDRTIDGGMRRQRDASIAGSS